MFKKKKNRNEADIELDIGLGSYKSSVKKKPKKVNKKPNPFTELLNDYVESKKKQVDQEMYKTAVLTKITNMCNEYLKDEDDELIFESSDKDLGMVITVMNSEKITSIYSTKQLSKNTFSIKLKQYELFG